MRINKEELLRPYPACDVQVRLVREHLVRGKPRGLQAVSAIRCITHSHVVHFRIAPTVFLHRKFLNFRMHQPLLTPCTPTRPVSAR